MSMSKRDYQAIARVLHEARKPWAEYASGESPTADGAKGALAEVILGLANVMAADSQRFSRALFFEACETGACKGMKEAS